MLTVLRSEAGGVQPERYENPLLAAHMRSCHAAQSFMSCRCCVTLLRSRGLQRRVMPSICCMVSADMICALKYIRYDRSRNMRKGGLLLKTWSHSFSQCDLESTSVRAVDSSPHACISMPPGPAVDHTLHILLCNCPDWQQFRLVDMAIV